jgi:hypothetical protein
MNWPMTLIFPYHISKNICNMKSSNKGAGKNYSAHIAEQDALPQSIFQPRGSSDKPGNSWQLPSDPTDPTPDDLLTIEEEFRTFIKSKLKPTKAPSHLLQKIRLSIQQQDRID